VGDCYREFHPLFTEKIIKNVNLAFWLKDRLSSVKRKLGTNSTLITCRSIDYRLLLFMDGDHLDLNLKGADTCYGYTGTIIIPIGNWTEYFIKYW